MIFHLLHWLKFSSTNWANIHYRLGFHLSLPLTSKLLCLSSFCLLLIHLFWSILLLFLHFLLMLLFQLFHSYWRTCFLFLYFSLSLTMIIVVFLLRSLLWFSFPLSNFIRQWFEEIIIRFISWIHDSDSLTTDSKTRIIGLSISYWSFFRGEKLNKRKILEPSSHFVPYLSYISNRSDWFKKLQE